MSDLKPCNFDIWLEQVCSQKPEGRVYDLAKGAWYSALEQQQYDWWIPAREQIEDMLAEALARSHKAAPPYQEYYRGLIYGLEAALTAFPEPPTAEE